MNAQSLSLNATPFYAVSHLCINFLHSDPIGIWIHIYYVAAEKHYLEKAYHFNENYDSHRGTVFGIGKCTL
jgi:hypothetical protein